MCISSDIEHKVQNRHFLALYILPFWFSFWKKEKKDNLPLPQKHNRKPLTKFNKYWWSVWGEVGETGDVGDVGDVGVKLSVHQSEWQTQLELNKNVV